jgi:hypothetical protein
LLSRTLAISQLADAVAITLCNSSISLNDDGAQTDIKSIEQEVKKFRAQIVSEDAYRKNDDYQSMIKQVDKYWEKLFADPIVMNTSTGPFTIQPQRTNNILERFFRDLKRGNRKKSGTISLTRTIRSILADTPLVKNLDNPEYLEIILDGCNSLEERFEKIDSRLVLEKLQAEKRNDERISPVVKKIIRQPDLPAKLTELLNDSNIGTNRHLLS